MFNVPTLILSLYIKHVLTFAGGVTHCLEIIHG